MTPLEKSFDQTVRIYYDLHVPATMSCSSSAPFLIALHGYGGTKESMMGITREILGDQAIIASLQGTFQFSYPFGGNGFSVQRSEDLKIGFGWATRWKNNESIALHHQNLLKLMETVSHEYPVDHSRIFLLAFSQPVALNYRFVFTYPDVIRGVVAVCGGIPGDWTTAPYRKSQTDVLHIATDQDPYYPLERSKTFKALLAERARQVECRVFEGSHRFPRTAIPHITDWLKARL